MMKTALLSASALFVLAGLATPVAAQDEASTGGVYVSALAGVVTSDDHRITGANAAGAPRRIVTTLDRGSAFAFALGYATKDADWGRVRGEAEFARQEAKLDALSLNEVGRALIGEPDKSVTTGMLNLYYDTPAFIGPVRAEFGAGLGTSKVNYNVRYNVTATGPSIEIPTATSQFAYQVIAGLSGRISGGLELFTQFRLLEVKDHRVERFNRTAGVLDSTLDAEHGSKSVTFGARYIF